MSSPFDSEGLWLKARLFINRALDPDRGFEEQAFWACCALELLGKSALAQISPLLVANPQDNGDSLLAASGVVEGNATSVQAKAIWSRCKRAFKPFNESEAKKLAVGRNEYIHSGGIGFDAIPPHAWWPRYWSQVAILLGHMGLDIEDFVDPRYVGEIHRELTSRRDTVEQQLEARLERARTMLQQSKSETLSPKQQKQWDSRVSYVTSYQSEVECPACGGDATIYGDEVIETDVAYGRDDWGESDVHVTLTVAPEALTCDVCRLDLADYDLLVAAGLDEGFQVEGTGDDIEYEPAYNNE